MSSIAMKYEIFGKAPVTLFVHQSSTFLKIKIPMPGKTESLNAAVATGIILYEKQRQEILDYTYNNTDYIIKTIYSTNIGNYKK